METDKPKFFGGALAFALAAILFAPRLAATAAIDPEANRLSRASRNYLAEAKGFGVKVEVWKGIVVNGVVYYAHTGIFYQPAFQNGVTAYTTVRL